MSGDKVRLYRFYNFHVSKHGEPFAMCDKHRQGYRVPDQCCIEVVASKTDWPCDLCQQEAEE